MGLFIGASILTVLELFDYAYEVSWEPGTQEAGAPEELGLQLYLHAHLYPR